MSDAPWHECEVAIVGGGMVGASLALALAADRQRVVLIEAIAASSEAQPSFDERTTALGNGARRIYETLGVWTAMAAEAAPIREIHVSDAGRFAFARLQAHSHGLQAFGYTIANRHLGQVLWNALRNARGVQLWSPARLSSAELSAQAATLTVQRAGEPPMRLRSRLVVAADGAQSLVKQAAGIHTRAHHYEQVALVTTVRSDWPARGIAYERFTAEGPLAVLPRFDGNYAIVWAAPAALAASLQSCDEREFAERLQQRLGWRIGRISAVGRRFAYELSLLRAEENIAQRLAVIGNAAQALHPIAAQGFNLGLRDAAVIAELIGAASDPGAPQLLQQFARRRSADRSGMIAFTDRLVRVFGDQRPLVGVARDLGLLLFDLLPPAKQALSRLSWGFGPLPRLSRGLSVTGAQ